MTRAKPLCRLIGHRFDRDCLEQNHIAHCTRCGQSDYDDSLEMMPIEWVRFRSYDAWDRLHRRWRYAAEWWRCPMCGGRFGRHDPNSCIPF